MMDWNDLTRVAEQSFSESYEWTELRVWSRDIDAQLFWAIDSGGSCSNPFEGDVTDYELRPLLDLGQFALASRLWARESFGSSVADRIARANQVIQRVIDVMDGTYAAQIEEAQAAVRKASDYAVKLRGDRLRLDDGILKAEKALRDACDVLDELTG